MEQALKEALLTIKATAPKYFAEATDHTIRRRLLLKMIQQGGNLMFNVRTPKLVWDIEVREPKVRVLSGGQRSVFNQTDAYEQLEIDHAELEATDTLDRRTQMINDNSPQQIIDLAGTKMDKLVRTMTRKINSQFYVDNSSGTNVGMMTGIRSIIKPASITPGDLVAIPASGSEYGGKSLELASLGGRWSTKMTTSPNTAAATDWPFGQGSSEYDYNTPKMFNTTATFNGDAGWSNNCLKVMRRMASTITSTGGEGVAPIAHLLGIDLYNEFKDKLEERERLYVSDYAKSLGFPDVMSYEGAVVTQDFDCPASEGYALNPNEIGLYSVHDQLFFTDGGWETPEQSTLFLVGFLGNWVWTPKYVGAYLAL